MTAVVVCLRPHEREALIEVDYLGAGLPVLGCENCGAEWVIDDDVLVPVQPSVVVASAITDEDRLGWDSQRDRAAAGSYWGRLDG